MTPTKASQTGWSRTRIAYASAGGAVVLVGALVLSLSSGQDDPDDVADRVTDVEEATAGSAASPGDAFTLFFVAADGMSLVPQERELPLTAADDTLTRVRVIAEHQLGEAPAPLASPFPPGTELRAIYVTPDGEAFVDLNLDVTRGARWRVAGRALHRLCPRQRAHDEPARGLERPDPDRRT